MPASAEGAHRLAAARRLFGSVFVLIATAATFLTVGVPVTKTAALSLAVSTHQVDTRAGGPAGTDALLVADPHGPDAPAHVAVATAEPLLPRPAGARAARQAPHATDPPRAGAGSAWSARGPPGPA
ncbi:hypothetical protein [Pseudonocardia kunmingensis]|uniref:Uncharacterized protein n=1 Tax=Pseudonocardia kunmingensis TaxID=630975 RepID=A0A543D9Z2_9PSEU|nr:hypothetical protein [Pseudonocardia kunmingensis]TQM06126.1 hypothetical protein FB558_6371 [Pseudonocardia kunmingensis]